MTANYTREEYALIAVHKLNSLSAGKMNRSELSDELNISFKTLQRWESTLSMPVMAAPPHCRHRPVDIQAFKDWAADHLPRIGRAIASPAYAKDRR